MPAAFFLFLNFVVSSVKILFVSRLTYLLFLIFLFLFLRRFNLNKILRVIIAGISSIIFIYGIVQKFVLFPIYIQAVVPHDDFYTQAMITRFKGGRIFSIFSLPTLYAIICTVFIVFIFHYLISPETKSGKQKWAWSLLLAIGLFNLILTQSFGGIIYLSVGGLVYLLLSGILKPRYLIPVIMVFALFFSIIAALRFSEVKELEPIKLRFSNWTQAARIIAANPLWGSGLGNYETEVAFHTLHTEAKSIYAHNFFLQFVAETGGIFILLLLLFLFSVRKHLIINDYKEKTVYITTLAVIIVYNLIDIGFYFFSAGLITAVVLSQIYGDVSAVDSVESAPLQRKRMPTLLIGILFFLSALLAIEAISDNFRKNADYLKAQKEISEATKLYDLSIALNPYNYKAMTGYASIPHILDGNNNQNQKASGYLNRSLELNPDSAYAHYLKSSQLFIQQHYLGAYYHAEAAKQKNPIIDYYKEWVSYIKKNLQQAMEQQNPSHPIKPEIWESPVSYGTGK